MSKSKSNVINPLELSKKYGTDALRIGLVVGNTPGTDLALSEDRIRGYKNFANKIWNAARFVLISTEGADLSKKPEISEEDIKILEELQVVAVEITRDMEDFKFYLAAEKIYHYFWHNFSDKIIEASKEKIKSGDDMAKLSARWTLLETLKTSLKLLHPFMPFITEYIWGKLPGNKNLLIIEEWTS